MSQSKSAVLLFVNFFFNSLFNILTPNSACTCDPRFWFIVCTIFIDRELPKSNSNSRSSYRKMRYVLVCAQFKCKLFLFQLYFQRHTKTKTTNRLTDEGPRWREFCSESRGLRCWINSRSGRVAGWYRRFRTFYEKKILVRMAQNMKKKNRNTDN